MEAKVDSGFKSHRHRHGNPREIGGFSVPGVWRGAFLVHIRSRQVGATSRLDAHWAIRTREDHVVQVHTTGFHRTSEDVDARIAAGLPVER